MSAFSPYLHLLPVVAISAIIGNTWFLITRSEEMFGFIRKFVFNLLLVVMAQPMNRVIYLMKPTFDCPKCIAGQISFWVIMLSKNSFSLKETIVCLSASILLSHIISKISS